ncbi:S-adenosyl-L-methionine-dependent methyltransferase [Setomelanomma holmii]|uniref:S-adenosyl-L-methionine-dependent methyltransferase n=1 Tax=Setomelanomma holmii TaxID=210430 RepID=A0A9P4HL53_9PLEO|nr:S-adenosyl-L-methionine-dependent methyltransferase [Setomelanomma holmii]
MSYQGQSYEKDPRWSAVDDYALSHLHPSNAIPSTTVLEHAQSNSQTEGLPNVLEVGTLGGYSTIWLANATPNTHVTSVEVDPHHAEVARSNIKNAGVEDRVEVRLGPGIEVLPQLAEEVKSGKREKYQLIFVDADKENNWNYVDIALGMCEPGACIIVDNVVRKGQLAQDTTDPRVAGARKVVENIGNDDRLEGVVIQTVGDKSYDGFLFAVVK